MGAFTRIRPLLAGLALAVLLLPLAPRAETAPSAPAQQVRLQDPAGRSRTLGELTAGSKAVVVVFLGTECPIANGYAPLLSELAGRWKTRGVSLVGVNSNPDETPAAVSAQAKAYHLTFPVLKDPQQKLADALGARVTPEAFLLDSAGKVVYHGRIDDSYASRARKNAEAKSPDLERAVDAFLAGTPVAVSETRAIGCAIVRRTAAAPKTGAVTYYRDVAPVLQKRCQACHRPGQVAPFSLLTYKDARNWAAEIKEFTANRQMPPWLAEPGHGEFTDVRRLDDQEIRTLAQWVDGGAPAGDPKQAPPARQWEDQWALGKPDLVLKVPEPYTVPASGGDEFHVFVLPTGLTEDKQVVAVDFRPGNPRVVHHLVTFVDPSGKARKLDEADPGPGYSSGFGGIKVPEAVIHGVWAPGNLPRFLPEGVGRPLPKGADIAIQVHYHKTGKPERDQSEVALYFAKKPVTKRAVTAIVGPLSIDIPAGAASHEQTVQMTLPLPVHVLNIMPHMHLLGKSMTVTALLPDGTTKPMVRINAWDYRWQDSYRYKEPLALPARTKIEIRAVWDNSPGNPLNPNNPPRRVTFGEQTTDEMAFAIMEIVPG